MISKTKQKYLKSLQIKKYRQQEQRFLVEGEKGVGELLTSDWQIWWVGCTADFAEKHAQALLGRAEVSILKPDELAKLGTFKTNASAMAVAAMKPEPPFSIDSNEFVLALDNISDPGNLGTIIRSADWYGVKKILASENTVDIYNPRAISASMGSFTRVQMHYGPLEQWMQPDVAVYGAFLDGQDLHQMQFASRGIVVVGNESTGISEAVARQVTTRLTIPRFGAAESLNAAQATAILLDNIRRSET